MEAVTSALYVVVPIYIMIATGVCARKFHIFSKNTLKELNTSVFRIFLPLLLFENMYSSQIDIKDISVVAYAICSAFVIFGLSCFCIFCTVKEKNRAATITQGIYRSNFALLGIALTQTMYGINGTEITGMLVAIVIPIYNVLSVILFEVSCNNRKTSIVKILIGIVKNPLIIGTCLGLLLNIARIDIPEVINGTIKTLSQIATPLALVAMGGSFEIKTAIKNKRELIVVSGARLLAIPIVFTGLAILFGYRDKSLYALFLMYSTPTAVASYAMASAMGGDEDLAGEIVMVTTIISLFSIGIGVYFLSAFGLV